MGLTSSRGKRPARLHSSIMGMRLSSMNLRAVSRTRRSSSVSRVSKAMKSTPRNLIAMKKLDSVSGPCGADQGVYCHAYVLADKSVRPTRALSNRKETFDVSRGDREGQIRLSISSSRYPRSGLRVARGVASLSMITGSSSLKADHYFPEDKHRNGPQSFASQEGPQIPQRDPSLPQRLPARQHSENSRVPATAQ